MPDVTIDVIRLQDFDDDKNEDTLELTFVNYSGEHLFVLGDNDAAWAVDATQQCDNNTVCTLRAPATNQSCQIKPMSLTWFGSAASDLFSLNDGDYKIEFSR